MEIIHRIWIILSLGFLTAERHLIIKAAELNQYVYFKGILSSKFGSKDILLWKEALLLFPQEARGYGFVPDYNGSDLIKLDLLNLYRW